MVAPIQSGSPETAAETAEANQDRVRKAAQQFEGLLLRELLKVLRKTAPQGSLSGSGFSGDMYTQMMDDALAENLSKAGGVGLAPMLERSFGVAPDEPDLRTRMTAAERYGSLVGTVHRPSLPTYHAPQYTSGATGRFQHAAEDLMASGAASRWSREGRLTEHDLASDFATTRSDGSSHFNVRDAAGYVGHYKCNLFAFELARRAGFQVPVVGRPRGWGYPTPNDVTAEAATGSVAGGWARRATGDDTAELDADIRAGRRGFLLTGSAEDRAGHMAVIERLHDIERAEDGTIRRIVFDGWEARSGGAQHLTRRTWNLRNHPGGHLARNGFSRIEILELRSANRSESPEIPLSAQGGRSILDDPSQDPSKPAR